MAEDLTDHLLDEGVRVNYMHSDTATLDRIDIIRDLRLGKIDVLVGINLLREGLDIPEVSLVAILDADKEGFLRNRRSLIQTMGRAARNAQGQVIMYADTITDSMREAMDETARRRSIQEAFNEEHGIVPKTIKKSITDVTSFIAEAEDTLGTKSRVDGEFFTDAGAEGAGGGERERERTIESVAAELSALPKQEVAQVLGALEDEMIQASVDMDFERAARLRDQIVELRSHLEGTSAGDVIDRLKAGARKGSAHATRRHYRKKH
jgi:excinuclease ABC subunit B